MCIISAAVAGSTAAAVTINAALAASTAAAVGSLVTSVQGADAQSEAAQAEAKYKQQIAEYEAELARQNGQVESMRHGIDARREYGKQLTRMAASGVDISYGSAANSLIELRKFQAFDADLIRRNTDARVLGIRLQGNMAQLEADNISNAMKFQKVGAGIGFVASTAQTVTSAWKMGAFESGGASVRTAAKYGQGAGVLRREYGGNAPRSLFNF